MNLILKCHCDIPGTDRNKGGTEEEGADPAAAEPTGDISGGGEESLPHQHSRRREGPQDCSQVFLMNQEELLFTENCEKRLLLLFVKTLFLRYLKLPQIFS